MKTVIDCELALCLPLNELDGDELVSRDMYGHTGVVSGACLGLDGHHFDGTDDRVVISTQPAISPVDVISVGVWAKTSSQADQGIIAKGGLADASNGDYGIMMNGGTVSGYLNDYVDRVSSRAGGWADGGWHRYDLTYDGSVLRLFIDGDPDNGYAISTAITASGYDLVIGGYYSTAYLFSGSIGEVTIHHKALNPFEVQRQYLVTRWRYR